jgi:hypothetical protein
MKAICMMLLMLLIASTCFAYDYGVEWELKSIADAMDRDTNSALVSR